MNKREMIGAVIDMFDENDRLSNRCAILEQQASRPTVMSEREEKGFLPHQMEIERELINLGIRKVIEDAYEYNSVEVSRNERTGELKVESYERWKGYRDIKVPESVPAKSFLEYVEPHVHDYFNEKMDKAIALFEECESDE